MMGKQILLPWVTLSCAAFVALTACRAYASDGDRKTVEDLAPLLEQARVQGTAHGILGGDAARKLREAGIDQPILVDVTTVGSLRQNDCRRLKIAMSQKQVRLPGWKEARDRDTQFEMNYCPGGKPPKDERSAERVSP